MDLDRGIQSRTMQKVLPSLGSLYDTSGFDAFLANPPESINSNPVKIKTLILGYAAQLERHERLTEMWKHQVGSPHLSSICCQLT